MYITFVYRFNTVLYLILIFLMVIHLLEFFTLARTQHPSNIFEKSSLLCHKASLKKRIKSTLKYASFLIAHYKIILLKTAFFAHYN